MDYRGEDRRGEPRIPYVTEAFVEHTRRASDRISDLSANGAFIETMNGLPVGSRFTFSFHLPEAEIRVSAEVRYNMAQIGTGVRFLDLSDEARSSIDGLVRERTS